MKRLVVTVFAAGVVLGFPVAGWSQNGVTACVKNGKPRIVQANESCAADETRLTWNLVGLQGPKGDPGPAGEPALGAGLRVVDAANKLVGTFLPGAATPDMVFVPYALQGTSETRQNWVRLFFTSGGFSVYSKVAIAYALPDCAGDGFVPSNPSAPPLYIMGGFDGTGTVVPGEFVGTVSVLSQKLNGVCSSYNASFPAAKAVWVDLSVFTPPFRLSR